MAAYVIPLLIATFIFAPSFAPLVFLGVGLVWFLMAGARSKAGPLDARRREAIARRIEGAGKRRVEEASPAVSPPAAAPDDRPVVYDPQLSSAGIETVEAFDDGRFDFQRHGREARARIESFNELDDGAHRLKLVVTPRGEERYRAIVDLDVPFEKRRDLAVGRMISVRFDPRNRARLRLY